jgi:polar amino acid transport system permease protein
MGYVWHFNVVWDYKWAFLYGSVWTIYLTMTALVGSTLLGLIFAIMSGTKNKPCRYIAIGYIEFIRGLPALVVLVWIHYSLPILVGISMTAFWGAALGLSFCQSAYSAEIFRAGIEAIPKGQVEAARSLGMSGTLTMRRIILPQAIRIMVPPFINVFASLLKWTSLASIISVTELLHRSEAMIQITFRPLEIYTITALIYFVLIFPVTQLSRVMEKKMSYT